MEETNIFEPVLWLHKAGFSAFVVGNQVRDLLLEQSTTESEVDIATAATPAQVADVLASYRLIPTLIDGKFGVVSFTYKGVHYESTTFREDIYITDLIQVKRYPDRIQFTGSAEKDSKRRDLTINAIYYNPSNAKYLDYVEGIADLERKIIRMIGDPKIRFQEDPLRMLRAVRFKHMLGFKYDRKTLDAIKTCAKFLDKISPNVVKKELKKMQTQPTYPAIKQELTSLGFIKII